MDGAGSVVETLAKFAALGVADQRVKRGILGECRARGPGGGRERGNAGGAPEEGTPV